MTVKINPDIKVPLWLNFFSTLFTSKAKGHKQLFTIVDPCPLAIGTIPELLGHSYGCLQCTIVMLQQVLFFVIITVQRRA